MTSLAGDVAQGDKGGVMKRNNLIAIAEALVPRTYQPIVVFEPLP